LEGKTSDDKVQDVIGTATVLEAINPDRNVDESNRVSSEGSEGSYRVSGYIIE